MMTESVRVVAVGKDHLWVEAVSRSACGNCQARAGCGHSLLSRWAEKTSYLKVPLDQHDSRRFAVNDQVTLAIPEQTVVKGSLLVYCLPLLLLTMGALAGQHIIGSEAAAITGSLLGLLLGGLLVKGLSFFTARFRNMQPVIQDSANNSEVILQRLQCTDAGRFRSEGP